MTDTLPMNEASPAVSRRGFIAAASATGFALSAQPIQAQTVITTDTTGLIAEAIRIPTASGDIPGYRALPATGSGFPVVLVVHEIFGLHEHIRDVCRRLAKAGYLAIAPDLYSRIGDAVAAPDMAGAMAIANKTNYAQVMSDLDATTAAARKDKRADQKRLAITGFCWGGRAVWLYAAHRPDLTVGAAWYGHLVNPLGTGQPETALAQAAKVKAPILGLYGAADQGIPLETIEKMKVALGRHTKSEFIVYPGVGHAFNADYRPSYNKPAAEDGWAHMLSWFASHNLAPARHK